MIYLLDLLLLLLVVIVVIVIVLLLVVAMIYGDQIRSVLILGEVQTLKQAITMLRLILGAQTLVMMPLQEEIIVIVLQVTLLVVLVQFSVQQIQIHHKNLTHLDFLFEFFIYN